MTQEFLQGNKGKQSNKDTTLRIQTNKSHHWEPRHSLRVLLFKTFNKGATIKFDMLLIGNGKDQHPQHITCR